MVLCCLTECEQNVMLSLQGGSCFSRTFKSHFRSKAYLAGERLLCVESQAGVVWRWPKRSSCVVVYKSGQGTIISHALALILAPVRCPWRPQQLISDLLYCSTVHSGMVMCLGYAVDDLMVTVCWISNNVKGLIKTLKFIEHSASSMLAITNLAICINLALIVLVSNDPCFSRLALVRFIYRLVSR